MGPEELLDAAFTVVAADPEKTQQLAQTNRTKAMEYWIQCELQVCLHRRFAGEYRAVVSEWYVPQDIAGSAKADGECDIILVDAARREPLRELYGSQDLIGGDYVELKTLVVNDLNPTPRRGRTLARFRSDFERVLRINCATASLPTRGFLVGTIFDAEPLEGASRAGVLDSVLQWLSDDRQLGRYLVRKAISDEGHGIAALLWEPTA